MRDQVQGRSVEGPKIEGGKYNPSDEGRYGFKVEVNPIEGREGGRGWGGVGKGWWSECQLSVYGNRKPGRGTSDSTRSWMSKEGLVEYGTWVGPHGLRTGYPYVLLCTLCKEKQEVPLVHMVRSPLPVCPLRPPHLIHSIPPSVLGTDTGAPWKGTHWSSRTYPSGTD